MVDTFEEQQARRMAEADARGQQVDPLELTNHMWNVMDQVARRGWALGNQHSTYRALIRRGLMEGYRSELTPTALALLERWRAGEFR